MKKTLLTTIAAAISTIVMAQSSIKVQAPNVVAVDEQFNVSFIIEGEDSPSGFTWEPGEDFQLVWGPQKGSSSSTTIINGKRTKSSQFSYTYILLPRRTGKFVIPEADATVKGNRISSGKTTIEVVSGGESTSSGNSSSGGSSSSGSSGQSSGRNASGEISGEDLFLKFSLNRTNVVVGEPITATLKLYQRVNIAGFEDARFPTFDGFWSQEVFAPQNIEFKRESLNDKIYNTAVLRSYVLIPQQAGTISIDPAELVCLVNVRAQSSHSNSIFDSFFQDDYRTIRKRVTSDSYTVHVSRLPDGAPSSFGGGVGDFKISAHLSTDSLKTHDAASLIVTITGKGNVSLLEAPKISFPPDFEVYDAKVTENTDKSNGRTSGSKTFEYPFIPRSHGDYTIDAVQYSYYDINSGRYVTLKTDPIVISVAKGRDTDASTGGQMVQGSMRKDVRSLGSDIRFIKIQKPSFSHKGAMLFGSGLFFIILTLIVLMAAAAWIVLRKLMERRADVVGSRNRAATKMAQKRLSVASGYLKENLYSAFYEELHRALLGFISDKLNIDIADMSKENISASLSSAGVSDQLVTSFTELLDACEFARYAPDSGHGAMNAHYESAVNVISSIDASMKAGKKITKTVVTVAAFLVFLPLGANAAQSSAADSLWDAGTTSYSDGRWESAAQSWLSIEELGYESTDLYYNIANAFFKSGDYAHSILYYERALKLDPSNSDARFNLEFAESLVQDKIDTIPEFFLKTWMRKVCWLFSSNAWTVFFLLSLACLLACCVLFLLSTESGKRRIRFFSGVVFLVLSVFTFSFAAWQKSDCNSADSAIIITPVTSVKSSPGSDSAKDLFILHEGTKVRLLDEVGSWRNIELSDGRQGWIKTSDIAII